MSSSPDGPTSPEDLHIASERVTLDARYEELHPLDTDGHNSVSRLLSESSLSKVNQYLDDLAVAFGKLSPEVTPLFRDSMWHNVLSRKPSAHTAMASFWRLDRNLEAEFVRLVFFHQHPMLATTESPMSMNKMLEVVTTSSSDLRDHIAILREGYSHEYLRKEIIVKPILKSLSNYAEEWVSTKYLAPYTALVGPSMCGKTRLLMELSKSICVVYISLRPRGSTGEPPRSVLADEFQLCHKSVYELVAHYYRLLAAIFDVVAEFFSRQYAGREEEDRLLEWYTYNHEFGGYLTSRVRHTMEELGKNEWSASAALTKKIEKLERSTRFIKNPKLKVMLAFDEARALVDQQTREAESLLYFDVLRRVLSEVPSNLGFFAILADRSLTMADYYPNLRTEFGAPTLGPKELYEPIYAISTFDSKVPPSPPTTWDELLSPPRLFSYGTPFFRIYAEGAEKKGIPYYRIATTVQQMALNKLLAMPRPSQELSESNVFALLGCTIQPPMHKAGKINSELVSSHMAQCLYLSPPSARVISEYPSQFTLSMAANHPWPATAATTHPPARHHQTSFCPPTTTTTTYPPACQRKWDSENTTPEPRSQPSAGHPDYTAANKIQVAGDASFSKFAEAAYDFFPNAVVFKMIMREPNDPPADSMPADGNSVKRAHPVDADGERRPAIALRTPGAYKSTQQSAVPGIKAFQLGCPTPFKLAPTTGSMHPLWEAGAMAPFRTTSIYSQQSTGSRSVTRAVTKDGHKGMSTPKTSAPKIHEVGPSPLATNTTAPRVPAGCQPVSTDEIEVIRGPLTATALRVVSLPST
ncbi:hypothetical protein PtB15_1B757 [Puccinia triticina]|nr:hypothetical protein PtB15_1B757 [Puccinia triticina]